MAKERENVKIYDAESAKFVAPKAAQKFDVAMHEAIAGDPSEPLPSDRSAEDLARLEPGFAGPTLTTGPEAGSAAAAAPAAGGARVP